jgi:poly-gamma-glutamate capsule biosynthesis protein CapA/YwtB (metallophosphatase superfamily)
MMSVTSIHVMVPFGGMVGIEGGVVSGRSGNLTFCAKTQQDQNLSMTPVNLIMTGDVNLMNVANPAVPFAQVADEFRNTDVVFSNLECCLYETPPGHSVRNEGFFADPRCGKALAVGGIQVVGIANNVHFGDAAILSSIARLDELGILHTGAGANLEAARAPVVVEREGLRYGFLQRSSVYWPTNHEAQKDAAGIAVIRGHTAYHVPVFKTRVGVPPPNRPGVAPDIVTWADADYLGWLREDIAALRPRVDVLVASCHWGLGKEVLAYMKEIARAAIDAGADIVVGHGPHYALAVEVYQGRPIFYGLGSFSFHTGHGGRRHDSWVGMMARVAAGKAGVNAATFQFVRHNDRNETYLCRLADEAEALAEIIEASAPFGTKLMPEGDQVRVELKSCAAL